MDSWSSLRHCAGNARACADGPRRNSRHMGAIQCANAPLPIGRRNGKPLFSRVPGFIENGEFRPHCADSARTKMLLNDAEWSQWSDREIGRHANVHHSFASKMRSLSLVDSEESSRAYTTKHGTQATMRTENIGRREALVNERIESIKSEQAEPPPSRVIPQ